MKLILYSFYFVLAEGIYFYGGTIDWRLVREREVEFLWQMGFKLGEGPCGTGCNASSIGHLVTKAKSSYGNWTSGGVAVGSLNYVLTGVATSGDEWEQGEGSFRHTFPADGAYKVVYNQAKWRKLSLGVGGLKPCSLMTSVVLGMRNDTQRHNTSPRTRTKPIFQVQHGCSPGEATTIRIPLIDDDNDVVTCRLAAGIEECGSACGALPIHNITTEGGTCKLVLNTASGQFFPTGWYAAALIIEDYPTSTITLGNGTFNSTTPLSSVPLQFMLKIPDLPGVMCNATPEWVPDTPGSGQVITVLPGNDVTIRLAARTGDFPATRIQDMSVSGPSGMVRQPSDGVASDDQGRYDTNMVTLLWKPSLARVGSHPVCFQAQDNITKQGEFRCVTIEVRLSPTTSSTIATSGPSATPNVTASSFGSKASGLSSTLLIVAIAVPAAVLLIIAAVVVTVILVKKKSRISAQPTSPEENGDKAELRSMSSDY